MLIDDRLIKIIREIICNLYPLWIVDGLHPVVSPGQLRVGGVVGGVSRGAGEQDGVGGVGPAVPPHQHCVTLRPALATVRARRHARHGARSLGDGRVRGGEVEAEHHGGRGDGLPGVGAGGKLGQLEVVQGEAGVAAARIDK